MIKSTEVNGKSRIVVKANGISQKLIEVAQL